MIIKVEHRPRINSTFQTKAVGITICDACGKQFEITHCLKNRLTQKFHFCDSICTANSHSDGKLSEKRKQTCIDIYGAETPFLSVSCREKAKETYLERFGVEYPSQNPEIMEKIFKTNEERYGVKVSSMSQQTKEKAQQTCLERYGVPNVRQAQCVKDKIRATLLERYGVTCSLMTPNARESRHNPQNNVKRHETLKNSGAYLSKSSKEENHFYELLCERFGNDNVIRYALMNERWPIDFYLKSINTYVQYDGAYGHGLDRPYDVISQLKTKRDVAIISQIERDNLQNSWFKENDLLLIRVKGISIKKLNQDYLNNFFSHEEIRT